MYLSKDPPPFFLELGAEIRSCTAEILPKLSPETVNQLVVAGENIFKGPAYDGRLILLREGALRCSSAGVEVMSYEAGDLLGFELGIAERFDLKFSTDFAIKVDLYNVKKILAQLASDRQLLEKWYRLMGLNLTLHKILLGAASFPQDKVTPHVHSFHAGDCIIKQGSSGSLIYTMVEGEADVIVDGQKVGSIGPDEIFGALAALTDSERTASVVAKSTCLVLSLDKRHFVQMLRERPQTVAKMVEDLGRVIVSLNKHVVGSAAKVMT